ncbi:Intradiol ring-cleavage dioxygenase [Cantharellus anzutake]|uniref:Intradiol ring-cleavage dioxygenase n=1 Tax=Cantharellus anzutake TaxID=1750568 RepID=UPI00190390C6|nr:Intradiol ring-cleavage dioxygenase [Cantharellus anzutake]KAF8331460.1 Intradiol ring-cleavage dioxygenase [Cantharellus anzutake]
MKLLTIFALAITSALAHDTRALSAEQLKRRKLEVEARNLAARKCAPAVRAFENQRRHIRRDLKHFSLDLRGGHFGAQQEKEIKNKTCVMTPEVTEGPYFVKNELVRQNVRENQRGVPLTLDIGVIDITSCKPLPNAFVEIWHANATGFYSGFTAESTGGSGNTGAPPSNSTGSGGGNPANTAMSDELSFLRGGWPTNKNGVVEMSTVYPGFYTGRTTHIHTAVQTNWTKAANGTIESTEGNLLHIGQVFFDESLNDKVFASIPYVNTTQSHTTYNADDSILAEENTGGYNAFADAYQLGKNLQDGVIAYITIGVDSTARYSFSTTNYWTP